MIKNNLLMKKALTDVLNINACADSSRTRLKKTVIFLLAGTKMLLGIKVFSD